MKEEFLSSVPITPVSASSPAKRRSWLACLRLTIASTATLLAFALAWAVLNNNFSIVKPSRAEFAGSLDRALEQSTTWVLGQYDPTTKYCTREGRSLLGNSATAHMVVDCASLSSEPRRKAIAASFVEAWRARPPNVWGKMVDPTMPGSPLSEQELLSIGEYQRWIAHGVAPNQVALSSAELEHMFSPYENHTGKATHQLFALYFYRKSQGSSAGLDRLMNVIEERIAWEAALDFRVTDLYLQRIAFLLASGRPDLVRPRWVERALLAQQAGGGWLEEWHGWSATPYRFRFGDRLPTAHATAQGMWLACMLKYRYPEWVEQNYK
jgi:hypothetical protein